MSCLKPNLVRNPKKHPAEFDKPFINIPDGDCYKCQKRKQNDYLVRTYFEFISSKQDAFFVTLDFDDAHLPKYNDCPCFDSDIIKKFTHALRDYGLNDMRYLIVPDYGDAFERPHYHGIFLFPKGTQNEFSFFPIVKKFWYYGSHTDLRTISLSVRKGIFSAIKYVTKYVTKDNSYKNNARENFFPRRYRALICSSLGWGAQALDINEFDPKRISDIHYLPSPAITRKMILDGSPVYLKLDDNDEQSIPFAIPRYYEQKLMMVARWNSLEKKCEFFRNMYGNQLVKNRHNVYYNSYLRNFFNSVWNTEFNNPEYRLSFQRLYPSSPYNGMLWRDIVCDISSNYEKFVDFIFIKPFLYYNEYPNNKGLYRYQPKQYHSMIDNLNYYIAIDPYSGHRVFLDDSDTELFVQVTFLFDLVNRELKFRKSVYYDLTLENNRKQRIYQKCQSDPQYYNYLKRKGFNFKNYSSHVSSISKIC